MTLSLCAFAQTKLIIPPISTNKKTIENAVIEIKQGNISEAKESILFPFTAPRDGKYRFEMAELRANASVLITAWNYKDERFSSGYAGNGEGLTLDLKGGQTYRIYLNQSSGLSPYILNIILK